MFVTTTAITYLYYSFIDQINVKLCEDMSSVRTPRDGEKRLIKVIDEAYYLFISYINIASNNC